MNKTCYSLLLLFLSVGQTYVMKKCHLHLPLACKRLLPASARPGGSAPLKLTNSIQYSASKTLKERLHSGTGNHLIKAKSLYQCRVADDVIGKVNTDNFDSYDIDDEDIEDDDEDGASGVPAGVKDVSLRLKVRQHVNPLSSKYLVPVELDNNWVTTAFAEPFSNPLIIDIGCSKGSWALKTASKNISINVLGLEIRRPVVELCLKRRAKWNLNNCHFIGVNANIDLETILSGLSEPKDPSRKVTIDTITIQFPDPHFKSRHKKRRVVNDKLVNCIARYLSPHARVFLQSDIEELTEDMTSYFAASPYFSPAPGYDSAALSINPPVFEVQTEREVATLNKGQSVYRMLFLRNGEAFAESA